MSGWAGLNSSPGPIRTLSIRPHQTNQLYLRVIMASILRRPVDLFVVSVFLVFLLIAATIDWTQSVYGSILAMEDLEFGWWPPAFILHYYAWWCEAVDPLVGHNPMWYETMACFSPFIYVPYYLVAIYAFIFEKEWIRVPTLMWGWGLLLTMVVVLREQLYGKYATKDRLLFGLAYGGYLLMPLLIMLRVARTPVFSTKKPATKTATKTKRD